MSNAQFSFSEFYQLAMHLQGTFSLLMAAKR